MSKLYILWHFTPASSKYLFSSFQIFRGLVLLGVRRPRLQYRFGHVRIPPVFAIFLFSFFGWLPAVFLDKRKLKFLESKMPSERACFRNGEIYCTVLTVYSWLANAQTYKDLSMTCAALIGREAVGWLVGWFRTLRLPLTAHSIESLAHVSLQCHSRPRAPDRQ